MATTLDVDTSKKEVMKIHLYELARPGDPDDECSVHSCKNKATHWWSMLTPEIALCSFHYQFPPKGKYEDLVDESRSEPDDFDYPDFEDVYGGR